MRAWRKKNPEKYKAIQKKAHAKPSNRFSVLKSEAKRRELGVSITFEEYKETILAPCFYCGKVLPLSGGGIDRISSDVGYVSGNIRPCCAQCNIAKSSYTELEFKEWALRLVNHWAGKN